MRSLSTPPISAALASVALLSASDAPGSALRALRCGTPSALCAARDDDSRAEACCVSATCGGCEELEAR